MTRFFFKHARRHLKLKILPWTVNTNNDKNLKTFFLNHTNSNYIL